MQRSRPAIREQNDQVLIGYLGLKLWAKELNTIGQKYVSYNPMNRSLRGNVIYDRKTWEERKSIDTAHL
jgi:hypothetical protein